MSERLIIGIILCISLGGPKIHALQLLATHGQNLPLRTMSIGEEVLRRKNVVVYVAVDTMEPYMRIAVDKEVHDLQKSCESTRSFNSVAIIGSVIGKQVDEKQNLSIKLCRDGNWISHVVSHQTRAILEYELVAAQKMPHFFEAKQNPLVLAPVFDAFLKEVFNHLFPPNEFSFFFHFKSHGKENIVISLVDQKIQRMHFEEQMRLMRAFDKNLKAEVFIKAEIGSGSLELYLDKINAEYGHLGYFQGSKGGMTRAEEPSLGDRHDLSGDLNIGISQKQLAAMFSDYNQMGVKSLFVYQESCNIPFFISPPVEKKSAILDFVYNYYRASGLMGFQNIDWFEIAKKWPPYGSPWHSNLLKLEYFVTFQEQIKVKLPTEAQFSKLAEAITNGNQKVYRAVLSALQPESLISFIFYKDLLRRLAFHQRIEWVSPTLKAAFLNGSKTVFSDEEKRLFFGHLLNPFYFRKAYLGFKSLDEEEGLCRLPSSLSPQVEPECSQSSLEKLMETTIQGSSEPSMETSLEIFRVIVDFFISKSDGSDLLAVDLRERNGEVLPLHHHWIDTIDSFWLSSNDAVLSLMQEPEMSKLDWKFFERVREVYKIPYDFGIDEKQKPFLLFRNLQPKKGSVAILSRDKWVNESEELSLSIPWLQSRQPPLVNGYFEYSQSSIQQGGAKGHWKGEQKARLLGSLPQQRGEQELGMGGRIVLFGTRAQDSSISESGFGLMRVKADRTLDRNFGENNGHSIVLVKKDEANPYEMMIPNALVEDRDGNLLVGAIYGTDGRAQTQRIYKFTKNGLLINSFADGGMLEIPLINNYLVNYTRQFYIDLENNIVVPVWVGHQKKHLDQIVKEMERIRGAKDQERQKYLRNLRSSVEASIIEESIFIFRFKSDGKFDSRFGRKGEGFVEVHLNNEDPYALSRGFLDPDAVGGIYAAQASSSLLQENSLDLILSFQSDYKILMQTERRLDYEPRLLIDRLNEDGSIDQTFGNREPN